MGLVLFRKNPNGIHSGTEVDLFVAFVSFCGIRAGQNSTEANEANEDARPRTKDHCPPTYRFVGSASGARPTCCDRW